MNPPLRYCPRDFNSDMTDPRNLAYCHSIQRQNGAACRKKRCAYCVVVEKVEPERTAGVQGSLFLPTTQTKQNKTRA